MTGNTWLNSFLSCFNSLIFSNDGTINSIVGSAKAKNPAEPAKLEVSFFESKEFITNIFQHSSSVSHCKELLQLWLSHLPLLQHLPPVPTGCCPVTMRVTLWSTAAATSACSAWSLPGSWAESPPCLRRPWSSCTTSCPLSESTWTRWSPPTRMRLTAAPWTSKQRYSCFSLQDDLDLWHVLHAECGVSRPADTLCVYVTQCNKPVERNACCGVFCL